MKSFKIIILLFLILSFKQVKSQCPDSIKVVNASNDSITFNIYVGGNNDTVNLTIYDRWGAVVKKVLDDSVMQTGHYVIIYYSISLSSNLYVYAYTSRGCSHNGQIVYMNSSSGIQQHQSDTNFTIFPNPTNSIATLKSMAELGSVSVYNQIGQIVRQQTTKENNLQIDLNELPNGIYLIRVGNNYTKIIKQ